MKLFDFDIHIGDWRVLIQSRDIRNGAVQSRHIASGAIKSEHIGEGEIKARNIGEKVIESRHIADGAITAVSIKDGSLEGRVLADQTITGDKFKDGTITGDKIGNGEITGENIGEREIEAKHIKDRSITGTNIGDNQIKSRHIGDGEVKSRNIGEGQVEGRHIGEREIKGEHIAQQTITGRNIGEGEIQSEHILPESITGNNIAPEAITNREIADHTITRDKLAPGAIQDIDAIVADAVEATEHAREATVDAIEVAEHPTKVGDDNYVYEWNRELKAYVRTDIYVKGDQGNSGVHIDDPSELEIVNNLTEGGAEKVLSAEMGRVLHQRQNQNECCIDMGEDGDVFVYLYDYSQVMDAEMDETDTGDVTLTMVYDPEAVPGCSPVVHVIDGGSGQPAPSSVGTDEIMDGSILNEDLSDEVKDKILGDLTDEEMEDWFEDEPEQEEG